MIAFHFKKIFSTLFLICLPMFLYSEQSKPLVLVSIAPHRAFVKAIAEDTVEIQLIVPIGTSSHTFEPTPKEVIRASNANLWFVMGEFFEKKLFKSLSELKKNIIIEDLRDGVELIHVDDSKAHCSCCLDHLTDLHIWLSPKEAKVQAFKIAKTLSELYPIHKDLYAKNLHAFVEKLDELHSMLIDIFSGRKTSTLLVSHPAYAYFCRDYKLTQLSVESEGKDPTAKQLTQLLNRAKKEKINVVFTQPQYNNKGTHLIARELNAETVSIDPYSENLFETLLLIAKKISLSHE